MEYTETDRRAFLLLQARVLELETENITLRAIIEGLTQEIRTVTEPVA